MFKTTVIYRASLETDDPKVIQTIVGAILPGYMLFPYISKDGCGILLEFVGHAGDHAAFTQAVDAVCCAIGQTCPMMTLMRAVTECRCKD